MGNCEEAAPQPPQALLFATSLRRSSNFTFDPEGQGAGAGQRIKAEATFFHMDVFGTLWTKLILIR